MLVLFLSLVLLLYTVPPFALTVLGAYFCFHGARCALFTGGKDKRIQIARHTLGFGRQLVIWRGRILDRRRRLPVGCDRDGIGHPLHDRRDGRTDRKSVV